MISVRYSSQLIPKLNIKQILAKSFSSTSVMDVKVGDQLPAVDLFENTPGEKVNTGELFKNKKTVLFAVPGAFTPGCHKTHLPGYLESMDKLKAAGVDQVVCVSVNDPFVMAAWGNSTGATGKIRMLADPCAEFSKAIGLSKDIPPLGGVRSVRYSMIIDGGKVAALNVEPDGTGMTCSLAPNLIDALSKM